MLITEILARNARNYGREVALVERHPQKNRRVAITWKAFDDQANAIAHALIARGVKKGDRVAHLMMNGIQWLPAYFGILKTGAWAVPLNFRWVAHTLAACIRTADAEGLIFGEEFIETVAAIRCFPECSIRVFIYAGPEAKRPVWAESLERLVADHAEVPAPHVTIDICDDAALYFTSGTTGAPKAARLTHRNLEHACYVENRHHHQTRSDNFLCIPPLYHTGAKMHWFGNFIVGAKAVILKGFDPRWLIEAISEEQVTIVWLLVPWAIDLLFAIQSGELKLKDYRLDQWRLMHIGAQPVPASLIQQWRATFPNHQYDTNYGLTESTGPGCIHLGMENMHKVGAIGVPGFDWEYRIVDDCLKPAPQGTPGELMVKGPGVMKDYYKDPEATAAAMIDGWLLTGDVARLDEDGFVWLVDRKKDVVITGGENIYPVEIEGFLMGHPSIQDAAVIGLPSLRLGEIAAAIIQVKNGCHLTQAEIEAFCTGLARYKRPRKIIFGKVPRNPTGKIEKPALRRQYAGQSTSFSIS